MSAMPPYYAVFFFPQGLEALGPAITPYLSEGPAGPHMLCHEVDTGGAFCEFTIRGKSDDGRDVEVELLIPAQMIRLIASVQTDSPGWGFQAAK
jgi:hypothetical protein